MGGRIMSDQFRHWLVTIWPNKEKDKKKMWAEELAHILETKVKNKVIRYAVFQGEESPTTKEEHIQMYVEFFKSQRLSNLIKIFSSDKFKHPHCESRKGKRETAKAYCMKRESRIFDFGPYEFGTWRKSRKTVDSKLETCAQLMELGWTSDKIAWHRPDLYLRYGDRIDKCLELRFNYYLKQSAKQREQLLAENKENTIEE